MLPRGIWVCTLDIVFFFQAEDGIRDLTVTGVQTCALPIWRRRELGLHLPSHEGRRRRVRLESGRPLRGGDRRSTRLNSSHSQISYAVFCLKKKTRTSRPCI